MTSDYESTLLPKNNGLLWDSTTRLRRFTDL